MTIPCFGAEPAEPKTTSHDHTPEHVLSDYTLAFEDTFDGVLSSAKWNTKFPWGKDLTINKESVYYTDVLGGDTSQADPFGFGPDGELLITAAPITGTKPVTTGGVPDGQTFTSGLITTSDSHVFKYGFAIVCFTTPPGDCIWTAPLWLLNKYYYDNAAAKNAAEGNVNGSDKFEFEIDAAEFVAGDAYQGHLAVKQALHYHTGDRQSSTNHKRWSLDAANFREYDLNNNATLSSNNIYFDCNGDMKTNFPDVPGDFSAGRHTVAVDWRPDRLTYWVDGVMTQCITDQSIISDQQMFLLINMTVGGSFPHGSEPYKQPDHADFPATMEIESVQIYQYPV